MQLAPVDRHVALILRMKARDDLHEGRLAGAVLADQAVDLAPAQHEIDVAQRCDAAERLGDAVHGKRRHLRYGHKSRASPVMISVVSTEGRRPEWRGLLSTISRLSWA